MRRPVHALVVVPLVVLAACAAAAPESPQAAAPHDMASMQTTEEPPASARMICSDDIRTKVRQALQLAAPPVTSDSWVGGVYTCHYVLPMGGMTLSDRVFPDAGAAAGQMATQRAEDGPTQPLVGLGQQAYGSERGIAVVLKDDQILTVDTTGLPERFGANDQRRSDLAYEVASDVLGCWTGDE